MKLTKLKLREIIQEVLAEVEEEMDEATTTASIDGYMTPHAFADTDDEEPDDDYVDKLNRSVGYTRVDERRIDRSDIKRAIELHDIIKKHKAGKARRDAVVELAKIAQKYSGRPITTVKSALLTLDLIEPDTPGKRVNEEYTNRWLELKNADETANQKLGKGVRKIRYELQEMDKFLRWYNKIRIENELPKDEYWKRTQKHLKKIKERLIGLAEKVQRLDKSLDDIK